MRAVLIALAAGPVMAAEGLAVASSTHDPDHALRYADRAMLIKGGRCLASGDADAVLNGDRLRSLYASGITAIRSGTGHAFLPG
jgi:iron complex transport system ATP-binding protein